MSESLFLSDVSALMFYKQWDAERAIIEYFKLPTPQSNKQWAMLIFPGGRREIRQQHPDRILSGDEALAQLRVGKRVYVVLEDAIDVAKIWLKEIN